MAKKVVLLVDDEESILMVNKLKLTQAGYAVETASEGDEGLEKARSLKPDIIVLDIMLPKIDGYKICQMLKFDENYSHIPIILLSARDQEYDKQLGMQTGANLYLTKSLSEGKNFSTELVEKIKELIGV